MRHLCATAQQAAKAHPQATFAGSQPSPAAGADREVAPSAAFAADYLRRLEGQAEQLAVAVERAGNIADRFFGADPCDDSVQEGSDIGTPLAIRLMDRVNATDRMIEVLHAQISRLEYIA